jgi:hypothetical protein
MLPLPGSPFTLVSLESYTTQERLPEALAVCDCHGASHPRAGMSPGGSVLPFQGPRSACYEQLSRLCPAQGRLAGSVSGVGINRQG